MRYFVVESLEMLIEHAKFKELCLKNDIIKFFYYFKKTMVLFFK